MFEQVSPDAKRRLWAHHPGILDFAIDHLNRYRAPCLIRMPTGTGKTGVIACLTRISNPGSSLVLTPWAYLREQMAEELEARFWDKTGIRPRARKVTQMLPSSAGRILSSRESQVVIATFTTLNDLRRDDKAMYEKLAGSIALVIADECHYEPAVEWGQSVKGLGVPTVLLTATPYRNDLKLFRIRDPDESTHHFTHEAAVKNRVIRTIGFDDLTASDIPGLCAEFAAYWKRAKQTLPAKEPRAIICCSGAPDIESSVRLLRNAGINAIGVHEQFEGSKNKNLRQEVPRPDQESAEVWIHQHKLTEGLDDSRFCCVALFTRIRNDRKLIQQIGRILRRGKGDHDRPARVLAAPRYEVKASWSAYLAFETNLKLLKPDHFREVVDLLLDSQPDVEYFEGKFRERFSPSDIQKRPQVVIQPSVRVRSTLPEFSLDSYVENCTDRLGIEDAVILGPDAFGPCMREADFALWVYASVRNSRLLQSTSLYEVRLETHCVVLAENYVLIADSRGYLPDEYLEEFTTGVSQEKLGRFLDERFRATHVSVDSSIPYDTVFRGGELRGHDLLRIPTSLTDRIQICRAARGASEDLGRRYVGMTNARLRKEETTEERRSFAPGTFVEWARSVARILNSRAKPSKLFDRYLSACDPPSNPIPRTVCVDLLRIDLGLELADGRECTLKTSSIDIGELRKGNAATYSCSFQINAKGRKEKPLVLKVDYDERKKRFWFTKQAGPSVHAILPQQGDSEPKTVAEFLNQRQDIVLIGLDGGEFVYQGRNFYRIDYKNAERALIDLIRRPQAECAYTTEKGTKDQIRQAKEAGAERFPVGSIFRAIAEREFAFPFSDELLICADLGTECADFVAASFAKHQLSLIHAKAGSGVGISASAFHEVVAQAMKNLVYLTRIPEKPKGAGSWRADARWSNTGIPRITRAPAGLPSGERLWRKIKSEILGVSNPELFVTLVTTGCCDLEMLKDAVHDRTMRTPETAQLLHLLDGLNSYARQLGVRLLIYDLPYTKAN